MEFKLIPQTIFEKLTNELYVVLAKTEVRLYLRNALSYSDQTWYMSSSQVKFIYIALLQLVIVSKQLYILEAQKKREVVKTVQASVVI
ncbi:MAG: hypothetical protein ACRC7W_01270, partial [Fusobacteriaceae bacterium]